MLSSVLLFAIMQGKVFVYDKVFRPNATQESVYNMVAKPIVKGNLYFFDFKMLVLCQVKFYLVADSFKI